MAEALGGFTLALLAALWLFCGVATASLFQEKRHSVISGFVVGLLFGVFGLAVGVGLPMGGRPCESCREKIHKKAKVCPWCGTAVA